METPIKEKMLQVFKGREGMMFRSYEIKDAVKSRFPGTNITSILPADYCYNKTNKGNLFLFPLPLFEYQSQGTCKYLGLDYRYTGDIFFFLATSHFVNIFLSTGKDRVDVVPGRLIRYQTG